MTAFHSLRDFLSELERQKELRRIRVEVDPYLEIGEIAMRVVREEGPALLFENVKGSPYPVAINLFGTMRRIAIALGRPSAEFGERLYQLARAVQPPRLGALWQSRDMLARVRHARIVRPWRAPAQEIREKPALSQLPALHCWPKDGGRFLTYGMTLTQHPLHGGRNLGLYRQQLFDDRTTGMHWQIQKGGGFHYHEAERLGRPLPAAVVIGADPATLLASVAPLPEDLDEMIFAGYLRGAPTRLRKAATVPIDIPAEAEFILEGDVPPQERREEGPFGDHFGHYSLAAPFPVFHVRQVTRRRHPIYVAGVVGKPPQEDKYIGDAMQECVGPLIRVIRPEISDLWAYYEAGFHNLLVVSLRQRYGKEAIKTALGLMGEGQLSLTKCIVTVDAAVNPRDFHAVLHAMHQHFDPAEDLLIVPGTPLDTLDFTSYTMNLGSKMILDATRSIDRRHPAHKPDVSIDLEALKRKDSRIAGLRLWDNTLLTVQVKKEGRAVVERLVQDPSTEGVSLIGAVSEDVDLNDRVSMLWGLFTRFDAARDVVLTRTELVGPTVRYHGRVGIDATWKPGYPEPLVMPDDVVAKVNARWNSYGL